LQFQAGTKPARSRSPIERQVDHFRPVYDACPFDPEAAIRRKAFSPPRTRSPGNGDAIAVAAALRQHHRTQSPFDDSNDLVVRAKGDLNHVGHGQQRSVAAASVSELGFRAQTLSKTDLPFTDVLGGESAHRRGHRDCSPPPLDIVRRESKEMQRPHTSPSIGTSLLPLQQRKSRWIGNAENTNTQLLPLAKALAFQPDNVESARRALASGAPVPDTAAPHTPAASTDATTKGDSKFLPKLSADTAAQASARPLGGAKTTGKLLSRSNTVGALTSFKRHESKKLFLLKGVPAHRPETPPARGAP